MRFSVWPTTKQPWSDVRATAVHAERTGWDGVWLSDHFMPGRAPYDVATLEGWTALAGLASSVPRVRLGMLVSSNTYRHPAVVAKMASTIHHMTGGRMALGLGAGYQENEHTAYGLDFPSARERLARLEEACAVIKALLTQSKATFAGAHYALEDAVLEPKPEPGSLPLVIGGSGEKVTLGIAARWADEWNYWATPEVFHARSAVLDRHCEAAGRDPASIRRSVQALVIPQGSDAPPVRELDGIALLSGGAAELQDAMGSYVAAGVDEFIVPDWNAGHGTTAELLDWFLHNVAAEFR